MLKLTMPTVLIGGGIVFYLLKKHLDAQKAMAQQKTAIEAQAQENLSGCLPCMVL